MYYTGNPAPGKHIFPKPAHRKPPKTLLHLTSLSYTHRAEATSLANFFHYKDLHQNKPPLRISKRGAAPNTALHSTKLLRLDNIMNQPPPFIRHFHRPAT